MSAVRRMAVSVAVAAGLAACADETRFVQVRQATDEPITITRVAVAPFHAVERPGGPRLPDDASPLIGGYVASAFEARGLDVVPPSDVAAGLGVAIAPGEVFDASAVAAAAHQKFGVDAVVLGNVHRFRDRSGEAMGSTHPASVGFEVRIHSAPAGRLLWVGAFDQTQVALGENLLKAPQYPGGGTRWLTAEEFARWGAGLVVNQVPLAARAAAASP
jgi:hypothetical protein